MRVLLDECVPRKLRRELREHEVFTVTERGWSGTENGELLALAAAEFDVFLTVDQNLKYQQNLTSINLGLILHRLKSLLPLIPEIKSALESIKPGDFVRID
jgi:hypothetical protein